ncbi:MAG: MmcB family DNA repair protein [Aquamicrobium sp.]|uniref:MmcB family DNA repair protein n=1 Tax=Aquamicrobium sp. TaxID=1872579 RepID=UPI00349E631A|nr:MmcB family DNA repair protein [Aquamicrobium sp.]
MADIFARDPHEDGRQSERALTVQRGVRRMLRLAGWSSIPEVTLRSGRRADIMAVAENGDITIIEIKSSLADLRADAKWHEYREFCDRYYFAAPAALGIGPFPEDAGFIAADDYGAAILREAEVHRLAAARRRMLLLQFARLAADRLHLAADPGAASELRER